MTVMFDPKRKGPILGEISTWSHSRLKKFEQCNYQVYKAVVEKETYFDDEAPAAKHGKEVHDQFEKYIKGESDELPKIHNPRIKPLLELLREDYTTGFVLAEQRWGFDIDWGECDFFADNVWARVILDVIHWQNDEKTVVKVRDWKTGKGSDIAKFKYADQMNNYATVMFIKYPDLEFVETSLDWVDKDEKPLIQRYTRAQATAMLGKLNDRALALTKAQFFPPSPSKNNCRFCDYAEHETCDWRWQE